MKAVKIALLFVLVIGFVVPVWWHISSQKQDEPRISEIQEAEPDIPEGGGMDKEEYLHLRNEQLSLLRGLDTAKQDSRVKAVRRMEQSENLLAQKPETEDQMAASTWQPLGPAPIPVSATTSYSGRVSAIAVHPTNPNIVYVGTAQGGLYRTLDGGANWTPMLDGALSLAIGSVAIAPSDPTTVFVGTGEAALSSDSFFGVGIYRIMNADTAPVISGPLKQGTTGGDVFTGRSVSKIIVHPTNSNIIFATTTNGTAGISGSTLGAILPSVGVFRTTNAMAANPLFEKLTIQGTSSVSRAVVDAVIEPGNAARLIITVVGGGSDGGVYLSTNALDAVPTFTRTQITSDGSTNGRAELAINKVGEVITVYAATGTANGTLFKSVDGGATFVQAVANDFCNPQCFYDIAVAVDPNDASKVYLGGSPRLVFGSSVDGGAAFTPSATGLHVDTHAFALAPSDSKTMYFGSDGGIWKTNDVSATPIVWTTLNNTSFGATQFQSLALHPLDRNYLLGGTQDNGTQFLAPDGITWVRSDGGDGGFAVIDKNSPSVNSVTAYHTYFNSTNRQIGFSRALTTEPNGDPIWTGLLGCGGAPNGINCADPVLFYAPMVGGPGNPNSLYFGTNRLYRSANRGTTMTPVSQQLTGGSTASPERISSIAIAPSDDKVRLIGSTIGKIYVSTTVDASTMTDITGPIPSRYVGRIKIDPTNANIAYVSLNGFGLTGGQHVWKTANLLSATPTWTVAGNGIPDIPVNAFVIDPANPQQLFAGTDIGVFRSIDGGANWTPFSSNLPRVAVFDMEIQSVHRVLRIATHGRGIWEYNLNNIDRAAPFDFDGDGKSDISVFRPENGIWHLLQSTNGFTGVQFGISTDKIVPADYDGDGKTDVAVYRGGTWYLQRSQAGFIGISFGAPTDIPVPADFDGDRKAELAVYRPSNGTWYFYNLATNQSSGVFFGASEDKPVPADYDSDGKADVAVFRPSNGTWFLQGSRNGFAGIQFGESTDKPVQEDYDGDGRVDLAVFRPSNGTWYLLRSTLGFTSVQFGVGTDLPTPGDYDGDGRADLAVFRSGTWFLQRSRDGFIGVAFGNPTDRPVPNAFVP